MTVFLDTNVIIYAGFARESEPAKQEIAARLLGRRDYATSGQVLAEFYSKVTSPKFRIPHADALAWLVRLSRFPVVPVTSAMVMRGAEIAQRYQISYWDGAIIAAAEEIGADTLFSEDMGDGQRYGSVNVVNPFREALP